MAKKQAVLGVFAYLGDVLSALERLKGENIGVETVYSPLPSHEVREAMGLSELGGVRFYTLAGGVAGIAIGIFLVWYTCIQWRFIVGGKPPIPWIPTVIPAFEFFILAGVLCTLAGLLIKNRMPRLRLPAHYDKRFTQDRFGILVACADADREKVSAILEESGAEEVRRIEE